MGDQCSLILNRKREFVSIVGTINEYKNLILPISPPTIIISDDEDSNRNQNSDEISSLYALTNNTTNDKNDFLEKNSTEPHILTDRDKPFLNSIRNICGFKSTVLTNENTNNITSGLIANQKSNTETSIEHRNIRNYSSTDTSTVSTVHSYYNRNLTYLHGKKKPNPLLSTEKLQGSLVLDDSFENALSLLETERPPFSVKNKINNWISDCIHLPTSETEGIWSETNNSEIDLCKKIYPRKLESENLLNSTPIVISSTPSPRGTDEKISPIQSPINLMKTITELHCKGSDFDPNIEKKSKLIETRIDYEKVDLSEKRKIIFKTPTPPQKYLLKRIPKIRNGRQNDFFEALGLLNTTSPTKTNGHVYNGDDPVDVNTTKFKNIIPIDLTDSKTTKNELNSLKAPEIQIVFHLSSTNEPPFVETKEIHQNQSTNPNSIVEQQSKESDVSKSRNKNELKLHEYFENTNRFTILSYLSDVDSIFKRKQSNKIKKDDMLISDKICIVEKVDYDKPLRNNLETIDRKKQIPTGIILNKCKGLDVESCNEFNKNETDEKIPEPSIEVPSQNLNLSSDSSIFNKPKKIIKRAGVKRKKKWEKRKVKLICSSGLNKRDLRKRKVIQIIARRPKALQKERPRKRLNSEVSVNLCNSAKLVRLPLSEESNKPLISVINNRQTNYVQTNNASCKFMPNPLNNEKGEVLYAFYEDETLIIVQNLIVSFWKYSKILKVLGDDLEWTLLDDCARKFEDNEIIIPYKNRICMHDSMPIYTEMRAKQLISDKRKCNLSSVYMNLYYFHKDKEIAICNSIQLDTVKCAPIKIMYTTISESRYFIMCWKQEVCLGKSRTGLCKYSLTPDLETLASIREFKQIRHSIDYLESVKDDKLVGFGESEITIWDHRTGDILLNIDLGISIGTNVGSIYCPSDNVEINNILIICQLCKIVVKDNLSRLELKVLAISMSQQNPSYRHIYNHTLPDSFQKLKSFINTGEYIILTSMMNDEVWIHCNEPHRLIHLDLPVSKRFYSNDNSKIVEVTEKNLIVDTLLNQVLQFINKKHEN